MKKLFGLSLVVMIFASCENSGNPQKSTPVQPQPSTAGKPFPGINLPDTSVNAQAPAQTTGAANSSTAALNPAHGAPGHRCDIAVGAPLNGATVRTPAPGAATAPAGNIQPAAPVPAQKAARLNPAHGAPGHDCAIPVGQPLKS